MRYPMSAMALFALVLASAARLMAAETYHLEKIPTVDLLFSIDHAGLYRETWLVRDLGTRLTMTRQKPENSQPQC